MRKVDSSYWKFFKPHYYLDLPMPIAAEYFVGTVDGELVSHLAVAPKFESNGYRATRLVVMPEWQGAGVGTALLNFICELHKRGGGRKGNMYPTFFHTSHPQLAAYLKRSPLWALKSQVTSGANKRKSAASIARSGGAAAGYGGHLRAVQGFKYIGDGLPPKPLNDLI